MNWKLWIYGLVSAAIGAAASAASNVFVIPFVINGVTSHQLLVVTGYNAGLAGLSGCLFYLKTHPVPEWSGYGRRLEDPCGRITVPASDAKDTKP